MLKPLVFALVLLTSCAGHADGLHELTPPPPTTPSPFADYVLLTSAQIDVPAYFAVERKGPEGGNGQSHLFQFLGAPTPEQRARFPGRWTRDRLHGWLTTQLETASAKDHAKLLGCFAMSGDARAVPLLAAAIHHDDLDVRISGVYGLVDVWLEASVVGGTESHFYAAEEWWEENRHRFSSPPQTGEQR